MGVKRLQQGSVVLGVIIGVVLGLAVALAVAVYVTKAPVPFSSRGGVPRSADQDAAEQKRNRDWDPNAPLYGKNPARAGSAAQVAAPPASAASTALIAPPPAVVASSLARPSGPATAADPIAEFATNKSARAPAAASAPAAATAPAPAAPSVASPTTATGGAVEPFIYFVQAGAYRTAEDAEAQRARVALSGVEAKVSEREQSGRPVFRVRVGPMDRKDDAERLRDRLLDAKFDAAVVRVAR